MPAMLEAAEHGLGVTLAIAPIGPHPAFGNKLVCALRSEPICAQIPCNLEYCREFARFNEKNTEQFL